MKCSKCEDEYVIKQGNQRLCSKHYRFGQMRQSARTNGKFVPTYDQLENSVTKEMNCPDCGIKMNWRRRDGASTVASLQHYRNGEISIVCLTCNVRHAFMDGDSYREIEKDHKLCPECKKIKPLINFTKDNGRCGIAKRKSNCSECCDIKINKWRSENKDKYNQYQRDYREKRKSLGNPVLRKKQNIDPQS